MSVLRRSTGASWPSEQAISTPVVDPATMTVHCAAEEVAISAGDLIVTLAVWVALLWQVPQPEAFVFSVYPEIPVPYPEAALARTASAVVAASSIPGAFIIVSLLVGC